MFLLPQGLFECCSSTSSGKPEFLEKEKLVSARPASNLQVSSSGTLDLYFQRLGEWPTSKDSSCGVLVAKWWMDLVSLAGLQLKKWSRIRYLTYHNRIYHIACRHGACRISHRIKLHRITSHHITSNQIQSHHITSHHIESHHITSNHITSHHITPQQISSSSDEQKEKEKATPR